MEKVIREHGAEYTIALTPDNKNIIFNYCDAELGGESTQFLSFEEALRLAEALTNMLIKASNEAV